MAILKGLAEDGGLFVPDHIPALDVSLKELLGKSYQEVAYQVMSKFSIYFTEEELKECINKAYDSKFDTPEIAPMVKRGNSYYLELFHGSTIAFKYMALSILPHLLTTAAKKNGVTNEIVIFDSNIRRYRKSSNGWICRCSRNSYYCFLSKGWSKSCSGKADAYTKRRKYSGCGNLPRQL